MNRPAFNSSNEVRPSAKLAIKRDSAVNCRERATADLVKSLTIMTANERLILERSAAAWSMRAELLDRVEATASRKLGCIPEGLHA